MGAFGTSMMIIARLQINLNQIRDSGLINSRKIWSVIKEILKRLKLWGGELSLYGNAKSLTKIENQETSVEY